MTKATLQKKKVKSDAKLKKELDAVFSKYVRQKYADKDGMVKCYTCSVSKHWKEIQNGHWIPRNILATRFDERNCRPQCVGCNMFNKGRPDVFALKLLEEYGEKELREMQQSRYKIVKYFPYEEKIEYYKSAITKLLKTLEN